MPRAVSLLLAATIVMVSFPLAARATANDPVVEQAVSDGIVALQAEVMLLVALGGYTAPVPAELIEVHDTWSSYLEGLSRDSLLDWLEGVDADGDDARADLVAAGVQPTADLEVALGTIGAETMAALATGAPANLDPAPYVVALDLLNAGTFETPASVGTQPPTSPAPTPTSTTPVVTTPDTAPSLTRDTSRAGTASQGGESRLPAPVDEAPANPGDSSITPLAIFGVATLALGAGVGLRVRRRSRHRSQGGFDQLLDAGRRMTKALDRDEIARIALSEAMSLADATHGAFIAVGEGGMELMVASDDVFDGRRLGEGLLQRIADTGQPINVVSHDEPALTALPVAILGVPVIGSGRVTGIITLVRPDHRPFGAREDATVSRLAPMVGSALAAAERHHGVTALSFVDQLTSLPNRRSLDRDIVAVLASPGLVAVAMVDVDHFKNFNDTNGHSAGDEALRAVGGVLATGLRGSDRAYRYGGEEFSLLLRVRDAADAHEAAERIRRQVEALSIPGEQHQPDGRLTVSIGVALVQGGGSGTAPDTALAAADGALYRAKEVGRNTVVMAEPVWV
jgi:diguanylate cyclase (GGDEF)-like protein